MKGADRLVEIGLADRQTLVLDTEPTSRRDLHGAQGENLV